MSRSDATPCALLQKEASQRQQRRSVAPASQRRSVAAPTASQRRSRVAASQRQQPPTASQRRSATRPPERRSVAASQRHPPPGASQRNNVRNEHVAEVEPDGGPAEELKVQRGTVSVETADAARRKARLKNVQRHAATRCLRAQYWTGPTVLAAVKLLLTELIGSRQSLELGTAPQSVRNKRMDKTAATVLQLNKELRTARSVDDLGSIVEERLPEFDGRHVATCIYGLATLDTRLDAGKWSVGRVGRKLAPRLTKELESEGLGHRSLSNVCWAVAKLSSAAPELESLSVSLALAGAPRTFEMNSQGLSNTCWAVAALQLAVTEGADFWRAACHACPSVIVTSESSEELLPQHLTTLVWAMAVARAEDTFEHAGDASDAVAQQAAASYREFSPQNIAMTLWAFAKLSQAPEPLVFLFQRQACSDGLKGFGAMQISTTVWAMARIAEVSKHAAKQGIFRALLIQKGCKRLAEFSEQGIANLSFALSNQLNIPRSARTRNSNMKKYIMNSNVGYRLVWGYRIVSTDSKIIL
ncbi:unnamed protein product [Cladocopium goreaui]|uniref:Uncharacterized protein n=1 Tax=Cladocopium goreaui TaxID=2562237 RepID=A0A9P1GFY3_9DINO|nr:unnamed protein product [Cladocopium goreaui]